MSKNDMKNHIRTLSKNDLKDLVKTYRIPLDLHPRLPNSGFTMDHLPGNAIGIYTELLWFSGVRIPFLTFLLFVLKYFKVHISQLVPLGLDKVVLLEVLCRGLNIVPIVTLFHDLPTDGYDRNDVERLCARLICLCEMREEMSIYDFMTLLSWGDAKVVKESHHLSSSLLERTHQGIYDVSVPALTKDHKGNKINTPYPEKTYTPYSSYRSYSSKSFHGRGKTLCFLPSTGKLMCFFLSPLLLLTISSEGMTVSIPYARLNGVSMLLILAVVLWAHNTFGNSSTHAPPSRCSLVLIPCIMLRLALLAAPFA
ncbi:hypothetical protein Tco_0046047 [Tanacetum coccineum]